MPDEDKLAAEYAAQFLDIRCGRYLWLRRVVAAAEDLVARIRDSDLDIMTIPEEIRNQVGHLQWLVEEEKP